MKNNGLKDLSIEELKERLEAEKTQLTKMKINHAVSPIDNPSLIQKTRRDIARIYTEISKRQSSADNSAKK
ncbi:MAG: 50S ribosomal protein L29 [Candidatus Onthomorpha sp.]|nr:50S ribosomal protein L29 [Bacteroidales bacterium]MDY3976716.1 50S ribosomal protein L29 [Candidatus Onthomorpha sp.]MCI6417077.1 50S ribosomal protein L29 [Bacteroidales bacterium]MCI6645070.1 50S ribosomal protein L29 [Bacteroidales bacterium]MCI6800365.1 50S ribosomal protein L29 [Bacteroidales bacterium]